MKSNKTRIHSKFYKIPELRFEDQQLTSFNGLQREHFPRLTLDFYGSFLSTKGHTEESAIGFNKIKKGVRSYYPRYKVSDNKRKSDDFSRG